MGSAKILTGISWIWRSLIPKQTTDTFLWCGPTCACAPCRPCTRHLLCLSVCFANLQANAWLSKQTSMSITLQVAASADGAASALFHHLRGRETLQGHTPMPAITGHALCMPQGSLARPPPRTKCYVVTVRTSKTRGAGTTANVTLALTGRLQALQRVCRSWEGTLKLLDICLFRRARV